MPGVTATRAAVLWNMTSPLCLLLINRRYGGVGDGICLGVQRCSYRTTAQRRSGLLVRPRPCGLAVKIWRYVMTVSRGMVMQAKTTLASKSSLERRAPCQFTLASARASVGVHPTRALNTRLKCDMSENPQAVAMSAILRVSARALCSSLRA